MRSTGSGGFREAFVARNDARSSQSITRFPQVILIDFARSISWIIHMRSKYGCEASVSKTILVLSVETIFGVFKHVMITRLAFVEGPSHIITSFALRYMLAIWLTWWDLSVLLSWLMQTWSMKSHCSGQPFCCCHWNRKSYRFRRTGYE